MNNKKTMTRQEYNLKIFEQLRNNRFFNNFMERNMSNEVYEVLRDCIQDFPEQRFGQIFCNYVYPTYRDRDVMELNQVIDMLFYGSTCSDPFYEESKETFQRLVR